MKRVAYICADPGVPVFGNKGSSIHVQEMIRALQSHGAHVDLFAARLDGTPPRGLEHVAVHTLAPLPKTEAAERERAALRGNAELTWLLDGAGPFDVIYERYSLWSYAGMEAAASTGIPGVLEVNAPLIEEQMEYRVLVDRAAAEDVARRAFRAAGRVIAVSRVLADHLHERYGDVCRDIDVVPNGVDPERFTPRRRPFELRRADAFTIGFVGTLKPWHGLPLLLDAFTQLRATVPCSRLLIVGDGPEREALQADVAARGLDSAVQLMGAVPPDEIPEQLARMDVAVAPYGQRGDFYFSPLKVYEYMAAGVPVVASRIGQLSELIADRVTGVLCEPDDPSALARALEIVAGNPLLRERLSTDARAYVLQHHTWYAAARRVLDAAAEVSAELAATRPAA